MLILTRKKGEVIRIGPNIEVVVTKVDRGQVRLGIIAPADVAVTRGEQLNGEQIFVPSSRRNKKLSIGG